MGANTKIEWAHHTFNPWIGCSKVSPGCANCYAEEMMDKRFGRAQWGPGGTRVRTSNANWKKPLQWDKAAAAAGERHRVFCASLADVFEPRRELEPWLADLLILIQKTPNLDWLLLTKRPQEVMAAVVFTMEHLTPNVDHLPLHYAPPMDAALMVKNWYVDHKPPENVWIGTSVENQEQADKRIPELLQIPAKVRFLSMEPLLGPVDLRPWFERFRCCVCKSSTAQKQIDWVIVGGESGHNARPMHPDWARSLRDQCQAAGVPFNFKQYGEWIAATDWDLAKHKKLFRGGNPGCCWLDIDGKIEPVSSHGLSADAYAMIRVGKHAAGRELDGRTWDEVPLS